jgi:D-tyrosyl-tRNA(Tyr) deacylase
MIAVLQRVSSASVTVEDGPGAPHRAEIGVGLVALVCAERGDGEREADWIAERIATLRVFGDADGRMNLSLRDTGGAALVVSQFTLAADTRKGLRPGFDRAAPAGEARELVERVAARLRAEHGIATGEGVFGATMRVELVNEGPATFILERRPGAGGG